MALKAEHTDVAVAALERVGDTEGLSAIAQRGRNKVAARRARVRLRQIEEALAPAPEAPAARMSAEDLGRATQLLREAEALVALADPGEAEAELTRVRLAWAELGADTEIDGQLDRALRSRQRGARAKRLPSGSRSAPPIGFGPKRPRASRPTACACAWRSRNWTARAPRIALPS